MKVLHIVQNKFAQGSTVKRLGLDVIKDLTPLTYGTCCWNFSTDEAKSLVGGMILLHDTKNLPSFIGGEVKEVVSVNLDDGRSRTKRIKFIFEAKLDCKNQVWRGSDHSMAWNSGILEV
ncbi:hypothetical protein N9E48_10945 [Paracoccaceae bacterium]|nr:hypothetical protein [Paracoccaceae bacterium]